MENRREFLKQGHFTKDDILSKVYAPNNFDGLKAHNDIEALWKTEYKRQYLGRIAYLAGGATAWSLYNVGRIT